MEQFTRFIALSCVSICLVVITSKLVVFAYDDLGTVYECKSEVAVLEDRIDELSEELENLK